MKKTKSRLIRNTKGRKSLVCKFKTVRLMNKSKSISRVKIQPIERKSLIRKSEWILDSVKADLMQGSSTK